MSLTTDIACSKMVLIFLHPYKNNKIENNPFIWVKEWFILDSKMGIFQPRGFLASSLGWSISL